MADGAEKAQRDTGLSWLDAKAEAQRLAQAESCAEAADSEAAETEAGPAEAEPEAEAAEAEAAEAEAAEPEAKVSETDPEAAEGETEAEAAEPGAEAEATEAPEAKADPSDPGPSIEPADQEPAGPMAPALIADRDDALAPPAEPPLQKPKRRGKRTLGERLVIWTFDAVILVIVLGVLGFFLLLGRELPAPGWVAARVEARLSEGLGAAQFDLGAITLTVARNGLPEVGFRDVAVTSASGAPLLTVPRVAVVLDKGLLMRGQVQPTSVAISGAELQLARDADGNFDLAFGDAMVMPSGGQTLGAIIDAIDAAFALPALAPVTDIRAEELTLLYSDAQSGRTWRIADGILGLEQTEDAVAARLSFAMADDAWFDFTDPAYAAISFTSQRGTSAASLTARVDQVPARDIAAQSPAFAFLSVVDAPISGSLRGFVSPEGTLGDVAGQLEIGAGRLWTGGGGTPITFDSGRSYLRFDPGAGRITFDSLQVASATASLAAEGHALLVDDALVAQLRFSKITLDPEGLFERPAQFDAAYVDAKIRFDPLEITIGQARLLGPDGRLSSSGTLKSQPDGWDTAIDLKIEETQPEGLLALWPLDVGPNTRAWLVDHLLDGEIFDGTVAIRSAPGEDKPRVSLGFEFRDAVALPVDALPPITGGAGYGTLSNGSFALTLDAGQMAAPAGGSVDLAGSVFHIADVRPTVPKAKVTLQIAGSIRSVLELLDVPTLALISKAGQRTDMAEGRVLGKAVLDLPLSKGLKAEQIAVSVDATLRQVRSDVIVEGYRLEGDDLKLTLKDDVLDIAGSGRIEGVPYTGRFTDTLGKKAAGRVEGRIELSQAFVDAFNIGLPKGMVSGKGTGNIVIDLPEGQAPSFRLRSDLNRMGVRIAELAWSKSQNTRGSLDVLGLLGDVPRIDQLIFEAPGLSAKGSVTLNPGGGLKEARFSRVRAGQWIDAPVVLVGRGKGASPGVRVTGGWVDIRRTSFAQGGGQGSAGSPMQLALDKLIISDSTELWGFKADLTQRGGLSGRFTGSVNGKAPVSGRVVAQRKGTAVEITSDNAGRVLVAMGFFKRAKAGAIKLQLVPRAEPGHYNGRLEVENVRVNGSPGLAAILNTISVVGLLDQLNKGGLLFTDVNAAFVLTPSYVQVDQSSATGPSLGITMDGLYNMNNDRMDMQGVISPIYIVNSIGQVVSKRGEGLFGFNYRMRGTTENPRVSVNPLSVLTPGMFREIFRAKPPPKVAE